MGSRPVINVPWWMAIEYCNWLSEKDGLLPAYIRHCEVNEGQLLDSEGKLTTDITEVLGYRLLTEARGNMSHEEVNITPNTSGLEAITLH
ncbi:SUMF1/EgtB/PvdO family nonheme iron enzyme [Mesotoga sp. UBA6090]|uniref:SUMF1/EgtB/PvdO family nonheme iron enzyme n=1 Tax=unclassified Mesotoga TaxID=1184398 RepID=UPI000DA6A40B